jgi:lipid-binding SYLF domain-containing protein
MRIRSLTAAAGLSVFALLASPAVFAHTKAEIDASADSALKHFYTLAPANKALAAKAAGVLIFGRVTKAGAGVAGEYGEGVLRLKGDSADYYQVVSASVGLTLGVGKHREIIMFMTQDSLDKFTHSSGWSAGADSAVAVVKSGAGGEYDSETVGKPILGFIFSEKGLIGDLSFEGSKITKIKN